MSKTPSSAAEPAATSVLREIKDLHSELLLYRALATVGTSTAVFAHEAQQPADRILQEVRTVDRRVRRDLDPAT
ncbi:hypothetical protein ACFV9U_31460, partial [Streptomyces sp. NPDC059876]|uniref:hypothetical protein n=1 Tax=Streptomyces sp. NPDC059876 TaxID=3346985 RepID=UPI0036490A0D